MNHHSCFTKLRDSDNFPGILGVLQDTHVYMDNRYDQKAASAQFQHKATTVSAGKGQCPDGKDAQDKWRMSRQGTGMLQNEHLQRGWKGMKSLERTKTGQSGYSPGRGLEGKGQKTGNDS